MNKKHDLYGELGVDRGADKDTIHKAYRKRALNVHPDTNPGNPNAKRKYELVKLAHDILMDDDRRAYYDETGDVQEKVIDNEEANAVNRVAQAMEEFLRQCTEQKADPVKLDVIGWVSKLIEEKIASFGPNKDRVYVQLRDTERMRGRFKRRGDGQNYLHHVIEQRVGDCKVKLAKLDREHKEWVRALEIVNDTTFAMEMEMRFSYEYGYVAFNDPFGGSSTS